MKVSAVMTTPPITVTTRTSIRTAATRTAEGGVGSVLDVDDAGHLRGMATDRDLAVRGLAHGRGHDAGVRAIMSADPVTVDALDDLVVAYETFRGRTYGDCRAGRRPTGRDADRLLLDVFRRFADLLGPVAWGILQEPRADSGLLR
jgi:CBS domain-containing protein